MLSDAKGKLPEILERTNGGLEYILEIAVNNPYGQGLIGLYMAPGVRSVDENSADFPVALYPKPTSGTAGCILDLLR